MKPTGICPVCGERVEIDPEVCEDNRDTPAPETTVWWTVGFHKLPSGEYCKGCHLYQPTDIQGTVLPPKY
jgi:hypothetical protein